MDEVNSSNKAQNTDLLDQLTDVLPWHRSFTFFERSLIVITVTAFISLVGCTLIFLAYSRSSIRRRYLRRKTGTNDTIVLPPSPRYESIIQADNNSILNKNQYSNSTGLSLYGTTLSTDSIPSSNGIDYSKTVNEKLNHSQSSRSSISNGISHVNIGDSLPSPPYAQINVEINIDTIKNLLLVHLTNGEHFSLHPAFADQTEFFIHVQLINNKILKKFYEAKQKSRSNLQISTWKNQQEKTTKKLSRTSTDLLICDEYLKFEVNSDSVKTSSLRFLLFAVERSGNQDLMFEDIIRLNTSMIPHHQQTIEFKTWPEITFGELYLGLSYLPTAARLTIKVEKLRYLFKRDKDQAIDVRLIATFFHHGRRFFQKKLPSFIIDESHSTNNNSYEINDIITQNIPQNDIQSIYVHFELVIRIFNLKEESIISCGSILLGEHTRYEGVWQKILEQPRNIHLGWFQFFG